MKQWMKQSMSLLKSSVKSITIRMDHREDGTPEIGDKVEELAHTIKEKHKSKTKTIIKLSRKFDKGLRQKKRIPYQRHRV